MQGSDAGSEHAPEDSMPLLFWPPATGSQVQACETLDWDVTGVRFCFELLCLSLLLTAICSLRAEQVINFFHVPYPMLSKKSCFHLLCITGVIALFFSRL
jgi:hypothetical protein